MQDQKPTGQPSNVPPGVTPEQVQEVMARMAADYPDELLERSYREMIDRPRNAPEVTIADVLAEFGSRS